MRSIPSAFQTHLNGEVTTLCTIIEIRRQDAKTFHFTDHDAPITIGGVIYVPYNSFSRTSIPTTIDLEVDQMELRGILNTDFISRGDVQSGLFDYAAVEVYAVNWADPTMGQIMLRRGYLGEVVADENNTFHAEMMGLTQAYTYRIGAVYQPQCRADLGDARCKVDLHPAEWSPDTTFAVGDVIVAKLNSPTNYVNLHLVNASFEDQGGIDTPTHVIEGWNVYGDTDCMFLVESTFNGANAPDGGFALYLTDDYTQTAGKNEGEQLGITQKVGLIASGCPAAAIDTGLCRLTSSVLYTRVDPNHGTVQFKIMALDSSEAQIGAAAIYDSGAQSGQHSVFQPMGPSNILLPAGTRFLVYDINLTKNEHNDNGSAIDDVTGYINLPEGNYGAQSLYGEVMFQCTSAGTTGASEPAFSNLIGATYTDGSLAWKAVESWYRNTTVGSFSKQGKLILPTGITDADGYFDGGLVLWESGQNAGRQQEVQSWKGGALALYYRPYFAVAAGDAFVLYPGCDKTRSTCVTKFANILNFRGEPDVPGQDAFYSTGAASG